MGNDTEQLITYAAIAAGAYLVWKLAKPISETVGGVGSGIVTATQGAGEGVSEVLTGTSSPFEYIDQYLESAQYTSQAKQKLYTDVFLYDKDVRSMIKSEVLAEAEDKTNKARQKELKSENDLLILTAKNQQDLDRLNTQIRIEKEARDFNTNQEIARRKEYGINPRQYLQKLFMPTQEVAQERREALSSFVSSVKSKFANPISKPMKEPSPMARLIAKAGKKK